MKTIQKSVALMALLTTLAVPGIAKTPSMVPYYGLNQTAQTIYGTVTIVNAANSGQGMNYSTGAIGRVFGFVPAGPSNMYRVSVSGSAGMKICTASVTVPSISAINFTVSPAGANYNCNLSVSW